MNRPLLIVGAGGHGSELREYLRFLPAGKRPRLGGFVDEGKPPGDFLDSRVLGGIAQMRELLRRGGRRRFLYITAVGDNASRIALVEKIERLRAGNLSAFTLIHPETVVGRDTVIGEGTCLAPGSIVTTRARIGRHCILNVNASVSHDAVVEDFVNLNPGTIICGNVRIGRAAYIGAGATVIDKIRVGEGTVIGAGAVVVDDIPAHVTAVGVPARVIKRHPV